MTDKTLNTAQALLAHIGLKTEALPLYGTMVRVKQWTASERIKYLAMISESEAPLDDEIALVTPQASIVALSMVDDKGKPLFASKWKNDQLVFDDPQGVKTLVENRLQETSQAFVEISKFNGVMFNNSLDDIDSEEEAAKN